MGAVGGFGWVGEQVVDLAGDVAFQAADDLPAVFAFCLSFLGVGDGGLVVTHAGDGDPPQGIVGLAVAAPIKTVAYGPSRRRLDGTGAAQCGEGRFRLHAFGVVTSGDQQGSGGVGADSGGG